MVTVVQLLLEALGLHIYQLLLEALGLYDFTPQTPLMLLLMAAISSGDADQVLTMGGGTGWLVADPNGGGGIFTLFKFSRVDVKGCRLLIAATVGSVTNLFGRPLLGLEASAVRDSGCESLTSLRCRTSYMGSPFTVLPTLILIVELDNLSSILNGPANGACKPVALCCLV